MLQARPTIVHIVVAVTVWIDNWEWQCCGEPFEVGSNVLWGLVPASEQFKSELAKQLGEVADRLTHCETHHDMDDEIRPIPIRGKVEGIYAVYWIRESQRDDPRVYESVPGTGVLESRETANGWEPEDETTSSRVRTFEGYIVELAPLD